jgi:formate dehydrogenase major subunit
VFIQESQVATCDIRPGRRPRGRERTGLVEQYRRAAGLEDDGRVSEASLAQAAEPDASEHPAPPGGTEHH